MCLIVRGKVSNLLKLDLDFAEECNADGFGIHSKFGVLYSFDHPRTSSPILLSDFPSDTIATIHYRLATHGKINRDNAHPFSVGSGVFLMHNGMLRGDDFKCKQGLKSDTAILADILSEISNRKRSKVLTQLSSSNRFCLLKGDKWKKFGNWEYDKATATWHSNSLLLRSNNSYACDPRKWGSGYSDCFTDSYFDDYVSKPSFLGFCDCCNYRVFDNERYQKTNDKLTCEICADADGYGYSSLWKYNPDSLSADDFPGF